MPTSSGVRQSRFLQLLEEAEGTRAVREFAGFWKHAYKLLAATYSLLLILATEAAGVISGFPGGSHRSEGGGIRLWKVAGRRI